MRQINQIFQKIDPNSLRLRLTAGVAAFSILGLGSLSCWTSWKMQKILNTTKLFPGLFYLQSDAIPLTQG